MTTTTDTRPLPERLAQHTTHLRAKRMPTQDDRTSLQLLEELGMRHCRSEGPAPAEYSPFIQHARNYQRAAEGLASFNRGFWNGGGLGGFHTAHSNEWAMRQALTSDPAELSAFILDQQAWLDEALDRMRAAEAQLAELRKIAAAWHREGQDPESAMVDALADAMKAKLARTREEKGRGGWDDPAECSVRLLWDMMVDHAHKPNLDMVDVANLAGMIWWRLEHVLPDPTVLAEHVAAKREGAQ